MWLCVCIEKDYTIIFFYPFIDTFILMDQLRNKHLFVMTFPHQCSYLF